jgi:hypothetical protein
MKNILDRYLDRVLLYANKPESESEAIRQELKDHLLQKVDDLAGSGLPREEAILETLRQHGSPKIIGYKLRGSFPWIDIRSHGTARGVIAIGPRAIGIFAFGGVAVGVFACGGAAIGLFSAGGFALGLLFAWGGLGIGGVVSAGGAIGIVAAGGLAVGVVAAGGLAVGAWVPPIGDHAVIHSHYTAGNVPAFLRSLEPVLNADFFSTIFISKYMAIIMPSFMVAVFMLNLLQHREGKRVSPKDDWLING